MLILLYVILGGMLLLLALIITLGLLRQNNRASQWQQVAVELGFAHHERGSSLPAKFPKFDDLIHGSGRIGDLVVGQADGLWVCIMDYDQRKEPTRTICVVRSDRLALPYFFLQPATTLTRALTKLIETAISGYPSVEFTDDPEFAAGYALQAKDQAAVWEFFTPNVRAFFTARRDRNYCVLAEGQAFHFHHRNRRRRPDQAREMLQEALELGSLFAGK